MFEADSRGKENNPDGLPADVSHLPGGGTSSGEVTHEGGDTGSISLVGSKTSEQKGKLPPKTPSAHGSVGNLGSMTTGTPGDGGEVGEAARKAAGQ